MLDIYRMSGAVVFEASWPCRWALVLRLDSAHLLWFRLGRVGDWYVGRK